MHVTLFRSESVCHIGLKYKVISTMDRSIDVGSAIS
jgi:hypothetical protein